jgi:hypothetical protein
MVPIELKLMGYYARTVMSSKNKIIACAYQVRLSGFAMIIQRIDISLLSRFRKMIESAYQFYFT